MQKKLIQKLQDFKNFLILDETMKKYFEFMDSNFLELKKEELELLKNKEIYKY